jgi:hypothetical protein
VGSIPLVSACTKSPAPLDLFCPEEDRPSAQMYRIGQSILKKGFGHPETFTIHFYNESLIIAAPFGLH